MGLMTKVEKYSDKTGEIFSSTTKRGVDWINEDGYLFINKTCCHLLGRAVLPLSMGSEAIATFYRIVNIILGYDNVLLVKEKRKVRYANIDDIADLMKCGKRQIYRKMKPLIDSNIIIKTKDNNNSEYYVVNPVYALFGHRISFRTYMDFRKHIAEYLTENTKMNMDALVSHDEETRNRLIRDNNE